MRVPLWAAELAALFWQEVGETEPFPRRLLRPIGRALPLSLKFLPGLRIDRVTHWLGEAGVCCPFAGADRPLRACLVARRGWGVAFVDGNDPDDEQRFSLAHELAHFLRDYWVPRRRAAQRLGPRVLEVFDGERPPGPEERLHSLLGNVPIGFHTHLLARDRTSHLPPAIAAAEQDADRLACELLAPAGVVLAETGRGTAGDRTEVALRLGGVYGLPAVEAARYAGLLLPSPPPVDGWIARLRNCAEVSNFRGPRGKHRGGTA